MSSKYVVINCLDIPSPRVYSETKDVNFIRQFIHNMNFVCLVDVLRRRGIYLYRFM